MIPSDIIRNSNNTRNQSQSRGRTLDSSWDSQYHRVSRAVFIVFLDMNGGFHSAGFLKTETPSANLCDSAKYLLLMEYFWMRMSCCATCWNPNFRRPPYSSFHFLLHYPYITSIDYSISSLSLSLSIYIYI